MCVCVITCMSQRYSVTTIAACPLFWMSSLFSTIMDAFWLNTQMLPRELQWSEVFQYSCWSLFKLFCVLFVLSCIELSSAEIRPLLCSVGSMLRLLWVKIAAGWGCYDAGRLLSLLQPWWIRPAALKRTFWKQQLIYPGGVETNVGVTYLDDGWDHPWRMIVWLCLQKCCKYMNIWLAQRISFILHWD